MSQRFSSHQLARGVLTGASRRLLPVLLLLSLALFPARARAAAPTEVVAPGPTSSEEALIDRGLALREARSDGAALEVFRKAYSIKKGARALAQVALAEQALGRWVDAEADLVAALGRSDDPWIARNKVLLNQALVEIQDHLGSLQVTAGVAGAEAFLNGVSAGKLPLETALRVNAGSVLLEVRAAGYQPYARAVNIPRRGVAAETVVLVAGAPSSPPLSEAASDAALAGGGARWARGWPTRTKVGLAFGAGAVVSAVIGTTFLFVRDGRAKDFNDAGCGTESLTPDCASLRHKEGTAMTVGVVGLVGAVVLGGVGSYLLVWPSAGHPSRVADAASAGGVRCTPSPGPGVSITCAGRF